MGKARLPRFQRATLREAFAEERWHDANDDLCKHLLSDDADIASEVVLLLPWLTPTMLRESRLGDGLFGEIAAEISELSDKESFDNDEDNNGTCEDHCLPPTSHTMRSLCPF